MLEVLAAPQVVRTYQLKRVNEKIRTYLHLVSHYHNLNVMAIACLTIKIITAHTSLSEIILLNVCYSQVAFLRLVA